MVEQETMEKLINNVKQARKLIKEFEEVGIPEIERNLKIADMNLHWVLWVCGEAVQYLPNLPLEDLENQ